MKTLLIIYPNWVPSNAVGVQRVRLIVNYLNEFGWQPVILTVKPEYYEEETSMDLIKLVKPGIKVEYVDAKKGRKFFRLYGDISLRAFWPLKKRAVEMIKEYEVDFIWVPIPPFYTALIGRLAHEATGKPYAIDYIDPWVHKFPGSNKWISRAKLSSVVANLLEPIAVKKAAVFTGVSKAYYLPVLKRNPALKNIVHQDMPYGFDPMDYTVKPSNLQLLWLTKNNIRPFIYAGAFLPKAQYFIDKLFKMIAAMRNLENFDERIRLYFVGTGFSSQRSVKEYAVRYNLEDIVIETKERIPYLEVLNNLSNAAGVLATGSTEPHYTASKIFQSIVSQKPIFSIFHEQSTVVQILKDTNTDQYLVQYKEMESEDLFEKSIYETFKSFIELSKGWKPELQKLNSFSARSSAQSLVEVLNSKLK